MKKLLLGLLILVFAFQVFAGSQQASSVLASTIITNARYILNDTDSSSYFWSDAELLVWLNDGQRDIAGKAQCYEATESVTLSSGLLEYAVQTAYLKIKAVLYTDSSSNKIALEKGSPEDVGKTGQSFDASSLREPHFWYEFGGYVGIYPTIATVSTTTPETAILYLVKRPSDLASTDTVVLPAQYDKALTLYIVAQALMKDRQNQKYAQAKADYDAEMSLYRQDFNEFKINQPQ